MKSTKMRLAEEAGTRMRNTTTVETSADQSQPPMYELDRESWIPLYYQIKTRLLDAMARGELAPGDVLPSEDWFARTTGVSRMTARQALNDLRTEGCVVRARGSGTFVAAGAQSKAEKVLQSEKKKNAQSISLRRK